MKIYAMTVKNAKLDKVLKKGIEKEPCLDTTASIMPTLSYKASKLIKKLNTTIENDWKKVRESKILYETPTYHATGNNNKLATIKPIYNNSYKKNLLITVEDQNHIEKIVIDRNKPADYTYEHCVFTDNGSATLKTYNSNNIDRNSEIEMIVDNYINEFIPKILKEEGTKIQVRRRS